VVFASAVGALEDSAGRSAEPLSSAVLGLAAYAGIEGARGADAAREQRARGEALLRALLALQTESGGFGRWSPDEEPDPYTSVWATRALLAARAAGWEVPQSARDRAVGYVFDAANGSVFADHYGTSSRDLLAMALRVLAEAGRPALARVDALWPQREQLTPYGLAQLALAMNPRDRRRDALFALAARRVLATRADERRDPSALRWWDSSMRTLGAVLEAAAALDPGTDAGRRLASRVLRARAVDMGAWWGTTHESAHAMLALAAWARRFTERAPLAATVTLDGEALAPARVTRDAAYYTLPFARVARGAHELHVRAAGAAYYGLGAHFATALGPAEAVARGQHLALHRVLETESGMPLPDGSHVHLGQLVRVRLFTYSEGQPPPLLTLHDVIGGGFEAVDAALHTSPRASLDALLGMSPDDDAIDPRGVHASRSLALISYRGFDRDEATFGLDEPRGGLQEFTYAVRATSVGTFVLPPARIAAQYAPSFAARSTAQTVTVDP
jgi:uncharacterized protein YfaS (alpha-2-macroglobulin family)